MSEQSAIEESGIFDAKWLCRMWKDVTGDDLQKIGKRISILNGAFILTRTGSPVCEEFEMLCDVAERYYDMCIEAQL